MRRRLYSTYILANKTNSVLYTGVTNNLNVRIWQHKTKLNPKSFCARYNVNKLVYYENYQYVMDAIRREKQIKAGSRRKKEQLIQRENPNYDDLYEEWLE